LKPHRVDLRNSEAVPMNSLTPAVMASTVSKGTILKRVFVIAYLAGIAVSTIGWMLAFGWFTVKLAKWLFA
jgi:hypothetical protein